MTIVVALIHGEPGAYGISFPAYPGMASGGATIDEAIIRGREGLAAHVEAMLEDGVALPARASMDELRADPELAADFADAIMAVAVDVDLPVKSVRINVTVDEGLLARIDRRAKELGMSRSAFLAEGARAKIAAG